MSNLLLVFAIAAALSSLAYAMYITERLHAAGRNGLDEQAAMRERLNDMERKMRALRAEMAAWRTSVDAYHIERDKQRRIEHEDVLCVLRPLGLRWRADLPLPSSWHPLADDMPVPNAKDCDRRYRGLSRRMP